MLCGFGSNENCRLLHHDKLMTLYLPKCCLSTHIDMVFLSLLLALIELEAFSPFY